MNKIKIISLVLAVIMLLPLIAACGTKNDTANNVTIIFRVPEEAGKDEDGNVIYKTDAEGNIVYKDEFKYDIPELKGTTELQENKYDENGRVVTDENGANVTEAMIVPTVLSAVEVAFKKYEKDYELSADKTYVASALGRTEAERTDSEKGYYDYWQCTINGNESDSGRQSVTRVYSEDVIVFTWTSGFKNRNDTTAESTVDPNAETTGKIDMGDTTLADTEEVA
ncbi:MAG: DUF4430 domain-containing protein [Ruminococcaceae bacterium]|nr:DUF4430 domain-containing protein [Oscillospiraceae bacterium]